MSSCVSTQIPHAVGIAMAMKITGDTARACFGYMGDGGTSEGDFHVALNFAGVMKAPVRADLPEQPVGDLDAGHRRRPPSETIALKALGYGVEPLRADGNDVLAVYDAVSYAADKARRGDGPTFVELLTYRVSAHSLVRRSVALSRRDGHRGLARPARSDPPARDCMLAQRGWLAAGEREAIAAAARDRGPRRDRARRRRSAPPALETLIDDVFEEPTWLLREQLADARRGAAREIAAPALSGCDSRPRCDTASRATPHADDERQRSAAWPDRELARVLERSCTAIHFSSALLVGLPPPHAHADRVDGAVLGRVVIYRNGVAFYERHATVEDGKLTVHVPRDRVDDFLKSLTVVDPTTRKPLSVTHPSQGGRRRQLPDDDARDAGAASTPTCC